MIGGGRGTARGGGMAVTVRGAGPRGVVQAAVHGPARGIPMADVGLAPALGRIPVFLVPCLYRKGPVADANAKRDQGKRRAGRRKSVSSKRGNRGRRTRRRAGLR